jgi:hypothetical protein
VALAVTKLETSRKLYHSDGRRRFGPQSMIMVEGVEQNRVLMYPAAEFFYESPHVVAVPIVPQGELIPKEDESYNHTARTCRVGPDNELAPDRSIRRNASRVGEQFHPLRLTAVTTAALRGDTRHRAAPAVASETLR